MRLPLLQPAPTQKLLEIQFERARQTTPCLLVSSMMRWIANPQAGQMDITMRTQALLLREQVNHDSTSAPDAPADEEDKE